MTAIYADTSSLVKFYYPETDSAKIEATLLKADRIYLSHLTITEMASALSRKVRTKELNADKEAMIWHAFQDDMQTAKMELVPLEERHYLGRRISSGGWAVSTGSRPSMPCICP